MNEKKFSIIIGVISLLGLGGLTFVVFKDPSYIFATIIPVAGFAAMLIFSLVTFWVHLKYEE